VIPWAEIERLVRRDMGGRGVSGYLVDGQPLAAGHLQRAAQSLRDAKGVGIVTGFCIPTPQGIAAETDGPPGALFMARALLSQQIDVALLSDGYGRPVLEAGCDCWQLPREIIHEVPFEHNDPSHPSRQSYDVAQNARTDQWIGTFLESPVGKRMTHLVAIERVGPSHMLESVSRLPGGEPKDLAAFSATVPPEHRNVCHNMRGESINSHTAKAHRLFEIIAERKLPITTIGIGDGGNEIGLGSVPWRWLRRAISRGPADYVPCRIATDLTVLAGVSNWGGYALALSMLALRDARGIAKSWDANDLERLIKALVRDSFCVDGVTKQRQPTVDGLPLETYLETITQLRELLL
jgi:hypothetical protein